MENKIIGIILLAFTVPFFISIVLFCIDHDSWFDIVRDFFLVLLVELTAVGIIGGIGLGIYLVTGWTITSE